MTAALVLTLHGISSAGKPPEACVDPSAVRYCVSEAMFMQVVRELKSRATCVAGLLAEQTARMSYVITFDDGLISDYSVAAPLLAEHQVPATFFVTAENIGKKGYCNGHQLREMASMGMEIASHGLTHQYLVTLPKEEATREIRESKDRIEQELGLEVRSFAPVGGHFTRRLVEVAWSSGYRIFATMIPGITAIGSAPILVHRNHLQEHHDHRYVAQLINGDTTTLLANKLRYTALQIPKRLIGMRGYDYVKGVLIGRNRE